MAINTSNVKYGFWVGIGLLLAFAAWGLITLVLGKAVRLG